MHNVIPIIHVSIGHLIICIVVSRARPVNKPEPYVI